MYETSLSSVTAEVETLLVEKFSAKGRDLAQKLSHVGRRLPKRVREQAQVLVEAQMRTRNPKLAHQYDPARVLAAQKACLDYLNKVDRGRLRSRGRAGWFTGLMVNLFIVIVLFVIAVRFLT
jgi:hypothetical protein